MTDSVTQLNAALEGRYHVEREIGQGGMAVVYLAKDLRHERRVALKVLKPELAAAVGAERFLAEIKTTANLQHPHILPLFDSGQADSFLFYVTPYMDGETLRHRIDRERQLGIDEALDLTKKVASALDYAHEHGIVHRDVKPGNILLSERGEPTVADFGIALAVAHAGGARVTETGVSLGTPHYMSPEQAVGERVVDARADVYSLGCVLYEMLVGEPPYRGATAQTVLAQIITSDTVSAKEKRALIPPNVDAVIRKALEKLPADRFTSAGDFARALGDQGFRYGEDPVLGVGARGGQWTPVATATTGVAVLLALGLAWSLLSPGPEVSVTRFPSPFLEGEAPIGPMELTQDGSTLVYVGSGPSGAGSQLWIRRWENLFATPIPGTEGASVDLVAQLSLSPDGTQLAFVGEGAPGPLRVVSLQGGSSRMLAEGAYSAGAWAEDGWVYFTGEPGVIRRVPELGGEAETLTELLGGELGHGLVQLLPGERSVLFWVFLAADGSDSEIWSLDLETRQRRVLIRGNNPRYASTGHLLFGTNDGRLMAAPFSVATAELTGPAIPVVEGLYNDPIGLLNYSLSQAGTLVYRAGEALGQGYEFVWVTRSGEATPVDAGQAFNPGTGNIGWRLSPDGARIAFQMDLDGNEDIWTKELPDGPFSRVTFHTAADREPQWAPDGQTMTFRSDRAGTPAIWSRRADGTGDAELVFDGFDVAKGVWSPDGEWLVLRQAGLSSTSDEAARNIWALRPGVDSVPIPLVVTEEFQEQGPAISRDGQWLAYSSNETGRDEVFVRPFPDVEEGRWQVSTQGGISPVWAHNGSELFFVSPLTRELVSAEYATVPTFRTRALRTLFAIPPRYAVNPTGNSDFYDVSLDDERFLMARRLGQEDDASLFVLVENWFEELSRVMPE